MNQVIRCQKQWAVSDASVIYNVHIDHDETNGLHMIILSEIEIEMTKIIN